MRRIKMNWITHYGYKSKRSYRAMHNETEYLVAPQYGYWNAYSISPGSTGWYLLGENFKTYKEAMEYIGKLLERC
jgi:hypothetical protein